MINGHTSHSDRSERRPPHRAKHLICRLYAPITKIDPTTRVAPPWTDAAPRQEYEKTAIAFCFAIVKLTFPLTQ